MSPTRKATTARSIVDDVFGRARTRKIWTGNYEQALPVSVQDFDLSAVLPAVFYMFRFGHRRGKGKFLETFGGDAETTRERRRGATIERVADKLARAEAFEGFEDPTEQAILGDLLLCFCLENTKRALGRHEQVQRVTPAHYMASWVDLPDAVANLRFVPEMIVAMLANQKEQYVQQNREGDRSWFAVGQGFEDNVLLRAFHRGVVRHGEVLAGRKADRFEEQAPVGLDQLLMIRLAQYLGEAPDKLRGGEGERISNQRPVAEQAARHFSEDIRRFVRAYARVIPRHAFVELLESCMAVGLTTIVTSVIELLFEWAVTAEIRKQCNQQPTYMFMDCSNGVDRSLRALAEQSMDDFMRRIEQFPVVLMALRLLDHGARYDSKLKKLHQTTPYATDWLNLLGELLHQRREEAHAILYDLERKAEELAERLQEDYADAAEMLRSDRAQPNPVWRLAEVLTSLQGRGNTQQHLINLVDSVLLVARPNGLAMKRSVTRKLSSGGAKKRDVRSLVLTDSVLDYLAHVHLLRTGNKSGYRSLSFKDFLQALRTRYGFCVEHAPPGMTISNELLRLNRVVLERRLRDLGLLTGVNDAEAMKQLRPRFKHAEEYDHGVA
jgi:hypothetical protein